MTPQYAVPCLPGLYLYAGSPPKVQDYNTIVFLFSQEKGYNSIVIFVLGYEYAEPKNTFIASSAKDKSGRACRPTGRYKTERVKLGKRQYSTVH